MKIIVDAFGGDNAPLEILKGCAEAVEELNIDIMSVSYTHLVALKSMAFPILWINRVLWKLNRSCGWRCPPFARFYTASIQSIFFLF